MIMDIKTYRVTINCTNIQYWNRIFVKIKTKTVISHQRKFIPREAASLNLKIIDFNFSTRNFNYR